MRQRNCGFRPLTQGEKAAELLFAGCYCTMPLTPPLSHRWRAITASCQVRTCFAFKRHLPSKCSRTSFRAGLPSVIAASLRRSSPTAALHGTRGERYSGLFARLVSEIRDRWDSSCRKIVSPCASKRRADALQRTWETAPNNAPEYQKCQSMVLPLGYSAGNLIAIRCLAIEAAVTGAVRSCCHQRELW